MTAAVVGVWGDHDLPLSIVFFAGAIFFVYAAVHELTYRVYVDNNVIVETGAYKRRFELERVQRIALGDDWIQIEERGRVYPVAAHIEDFRQFANEVEAAAKAFAHIEIVDVRAEREL